MTPEARRKEIALLTAKEIFELVREDLLLVEQELMRQSGDGVRAGVRDYQLFAGGRGKADAPGVAADRQSLRGPAQGRFDSACRRCGIAAQRDADSR